ncbi:putative porin [Pseudoalteromonas sp. SSDWG2]|uniref:putative porin n=1 Tax=Pseudoalteromonas sp. SSDWG2 TaxID=3139391 RepID=UPI003BAA0125
MKKLSLAIASVLFSGVAAAQSYQSITDFEYLHADSNNYYSMQSKYYFAPKKVLGPWDQFDYINKTTNVFGGLAEGDDTSGFNVGGEYFVENFVIGASYEEFDFDGFGYFDGNTVSVGYLFNPDLLVKLERIDYDGSDELYLVSGQYNHQLNATDYLGFTARVGDDLDYREFSAKYFTELQNGHYLALEATILDTEGAGNDWMLGANYYFSEATSIFAHISDDENYGFGVQHYFTKNFALTAGYSNNADYGNDDQYYVKVTAQF